MPSMSPRTQQMQMAAGAGVDQATQMFEKGFSDMAYNVLMSRFPDLVQDVVTFKILDTDLDNGSAVGAFVVMRGDQPLYIPVVMSDNAIKPIEMVYHKALNIFLPLTKAWLDELDKTTLSSLGKGIKTPESLYSDVDIRNIVVPPITGRFSYAAWAPVIEYDVARTINLDALEKKASEPKMALLDFLREAPNAIKEAFLIVVGRHAPLLKYAASVYGVTALKEACRMHAEKTAAKQLSGGGLWIADVDTTPTEFRRIFGDRAAEAYAGVRKRGYAAKDERLKRNMAVQTQPYDRWVEPKQPGVYVLYSADTEEKPAFVMPNPIDLFDKGTRYGRRPAVPGHNPLIDNSYYDPAPFGDSNRVYPEGRPDEGEFVVRRGYDAKPYLAVFPNGDYLECDQLVGRDSVADAISGGPLHKRLFQDLTGEPRTGLGMWVRQRGTTFQATTPLEIKSITTKDGVRRVKISTRFGMDEKTVITDPTHPYNTIWMPKGANVVYLPSDFIWVPLKERLKPSDFFTSALDLASATASALASVGAKKVSIKNASAGQFSINGGAPLDKIPALRKLAEDCMLAVETAEHLLTKAAAERSAEAWIVSDEQLGHAQVLLDKKAADESGSKSDKGSDSKPKPKKKPESSSSSGGGGGGGGGGMPGGGDDPMADPATQAAMMAAAAPPEPPPPSPVELAAMEFQQHIDSEAQKLQEKSMMLAALAQRAREIESGAPPMASVQSQAMGAPPATGLSGTMAAPPPGVSAAPLPGMGGGMGMPQDPMAGAAPGFGMPPMPSAGGAPPMDGGAPGMDPMGGGAPGMDPMAGGAPPMGGMDPMAGGDPSMAGAPTPPPPMAMMGPDGPSASTLADQINPQFLGAASALHSGDLFDAAAVSSLAQSPAVKELVGQYLPNLEKALDNLNRVLLSLWMQEPQLKADIGESTFADLEDNMRTTQRNMGDLVLRLSQGAHVLKGQFEHEAT